jgi:hypothetical protein
MHGANSVLKTVMNGSWIHQMREPELGYAPQTKRMSDGDESIHWIVDYLAFIAAHAVAIGLKITLVERIGAAFLG